MSFYLNELQVGKFRIEKLVNVWIPHLKSLPLNHYMSQKKTFTRKPSNTWKFSYTNLKFHLKLAIMAKNSFWHTWNLKLSTWKPLFHTPQNSTLKLSTTWRTFFHTFFETSTLKLSTNQKTLLHTFQLKTWNLKNTLPHLKTYNTLKKFLPHLPLTWICYKLLVCTRRKRPICDHHIYNYLQLFGLCN